MIKILVPTLKSGHDVLEVEATEAKQQVKELMKNRGLWAFINDAPVMTPDELDAIDFGALENPEVEMQEGLRGGL